MHAASKSSTGVPPRRGRALLAYGSPSHRTRRLGPSGSRSLTRPTPNPATGPDTGAPQPRHPKTAPAGATAPTPTWAPHEGIPLDRECSTGCRRCQAAPGRGRSPSGISGTRCGPWGALRLFRAGISSLRRPTGGHRRPPNETGGLSGGWGQSGHTTSTPNTQPSNRATDQQPQHQRYHTVTHNSNN